jgi:hypothetical protein
MSKLKPFLLGAIVGAGCFFVGLQYHIVRTHDGYQFVPRTPQHSLGLAYADVRDWNAEQWADRPELARALVAHGSSGMIASSVAENLADSITSENSTLDQLKSFITEESGDDKFDSMFSLPDLSLPDPDATSSNDGQQDSLIPFPRATQDTSSSGMVAGDESSTASGRTNVAKRSDLSIDDVFSTGSGSPDNQSDSPATQSGRFGALSDYLSGRSDSLSGRSNGSSGLNAAGSSSGFGSSTSPSSTFSEVQPDSRSVTGGTLAGSQFDRDAAATEGLLFGDAEYDTEDEQDESLSSRFSTFKPDSFNSDSANSASGSTATPGNSGLSGGSYAGEETGVLDNMTRALDRRAADALARARAGFAEEANSAFSDSSQAVGGYLRNRMGETFGNGSSSSMFTESQDSAGQEVPLPLKALQDGFDPFLDWRK